MSNFFDTVRSLQEATWGQEADQLSQIAHSATRSGRDYRTHMDAHHAHARASHFHEKAAGETQHEFTRKYHEQMSKHHDILSNLHQKHMESK